MRDPERKICNRDAESTRADRMRVEGHVEVELCASLASRHSEHWVAASLIVADNDAEDVTQKDSQSRLGRLYAPPPTIVVVVHSSTKDASDEECVVR